MIAEDAQPAFVMKMKKALNSPHSERMVRCFSTPVDEYAAANSISMSILP
ncbi:MAG: hypothetical protein K0R22_707 [Sporomusa sp.]|jgi:hypothetical protein|nr:hypothetical protein [Sporomusa sp.]